MRLRLILATLPLLSTTLALAQQTAATDATRAADKPSNATHPWVIPKYSDWTKLEYQHRGAKLILTTIADPSRRHTCRVESLTVDNLVCKGHTYRAQDVAALVIPGVDGHAGRWITGFFATGAGAITAAVFLASVSVFAAVPLAVAGGLILLITPMAAMAADADTPDGLLYLAPGQTLQIKLRY